MPSTSRGSTTKLVKLLLLLLSIFPSPIISVNLMILLGTIETNSILFFFPISPNLASNVSKFEVPLTISIRDFSLFNLANF